MHCAVEFISVYCESSIIILFLIIFAILTHCTGDVYTLFMYVVRCFVELQRAFFST